MSSTLTSTEPTTEVTDGRVNLRTNRVFKFPPTWRARSGSYLRIKPDGTVSYHNPNCLKDAAPGSKPFRLPSMNPRNEGAAAVIERLKTVITKRAAKDRVENHVRFVGRPCKDGYFIAATDGSTALLTKGPGTGEPITAFDRPFHDSKIVCSLMDPEFHNVVKRALTMADDSSKVQLLCSIGPNGAKTLKVASSIPNVGEFCESLVPVAAVDFHFAINGKLLEEICGAWPLRILYSGPNHAVMFEPAGGEFRYIVMPYSDKLTDSERADLEGFGYEAVSESNMPEPAADAKPDPVPPEPCVHEYDDATMSPTPMCIRCGADYPEELLPKFKYLGIAINTDEQTTHYDYLLARDEEHALELLADLRPSCIPVSVFTSKELLEFADEVIRRPEADIRESMATLENEAQS